MNLRLIAAVLIFTAAITAGCSAQSDPPDLSAPFPTQTGETQALEPSPTYKPLPTETRTSQDSFHSDWKLSNHAMPSRRSDTAASECATCHSPLNVGPGSPISTSQTCSSCKSSGGSNGTLVPLDSSESLSARSKIGCESCHEVENGFASSEIGWLNPQSGAHEPMGSADELCAKCHLDQTHLRPVDPSGLAHQELGCTDCHDPHSLKSSCANEACHATHIEEIDMIKQYTPPSSHLKVKPGQCSECHPDRALIVWPEGAPHMGQQHIGLSCSACHDASNLELGVSEDGLRWDTTFELRVEGRTITIPTSSHQFGRAVRCERCHYPKNPWGLKESATLDGLKR